MPDPTGSRPSLHPKYRPDIDGLRAIAVLAVLAFHAFPDAVGGGFVGVDVFFVISGFLISSILFANFEQRSFTYAGFYSRRIRRIFPALAVVLIATFAAGWFLLLPDELAQVGQYMAAGSGFVSNLLSWHEAGYFDNASETKPLLHLWSLGVEEQFYILWPLLIGVCWKYRFNFLAVTLLVAAASFGINI
ncbi:MAG TPA: acyltransferase, partial [Gammaproteobacteria bacterium]|nr:acyltransferase [Gammaproteobacteria bacterium]